MGVSTTDAARRRDGDSDPLGRHVEQGARRGEDDLQGGAGRPYDQRLRSKKLTREPTFEDLTSEIARHLDAEQEPEGLGLGDGSCGAVETSTKRQGKPARGGENERNCQEREVIVARAMERLRAAVGVVEDGEVAGDVRRGSGSRGKQHQPEP